MALFGETPFSGTERYFNNRNMKLFFENESRTKARSGDVDGVRNRGIIPRERNCL